MKKVNAWKYVSVLSILLGLATLSPAPIKDKQSAQHEIGQHTAQQRFQDMKSNGTKGVVGEVIAKTNEDGTGVDPVLGDATAKPIIANALASNKEAEQILAADNKRIEQENQKSQFPWMAGLLAFLGCFGLFYMIRLWLEKNGPAPKKRIRPILDEEAWQ